MFRASSSFGVFFLFFLFKQESTYQFVSFNAQNEPFFGFSFIFFFLGGGEGGVCEARREGLLVIYLHVSHTLH